MTNWVIWLVFAAEVSAMLAVVPSRLNWLRRHPVDLAIVLLTPPFLPASMQALRVMRLFRLLPLLKLGLQWRLIFSSTGVRYVAFLALLTVLAGGAAFAAIEDEPTMWSGLYWAVTTMTTVGYGDVSPLTSGGQALAIPVMLVGVGFVAILTGAAAQRFLAPAVEQIERGVEEVEMEEADVLREVREISVRLKRVEQALARRPP
jgi:voltage-gated potassium channel